MHYYSFKKTYSIGLIIFILIIVAHYLNFLTWPENFLRNFYARALQSINYHQTTPINNFNCQTSTTNIELDTLKAKNDLLEQENSQMRGQLNFIKTNNYQTIAAEVIAQNLDTVDRTIILNRGAEAGVQIGQPVIFADGILIGKIFKVEPQLSFARVLSDNQSKIAATVQNSDHSLGVVEGGFGLSIKMNFIPRNEIIIPDDRVITSGLELGIPRGLIIGKVAAVENEAYQPFQQAIISPSIDYEKINIVGILKPN